MYDKIFKDDSEVEPRVLPRQSLAAISHIPTVDEVSLTMDYPQKANYSMQKAISAPNLGHNTYAAWKQQVPLANGHKKFDGVGQKPSLHSPTPSNKRVHYSNTTAKCSDQVQSSYSKDSRLKFYQKVGTDPPTSNVKCNFVQKTNDAKSTPVPVNKETGRVYHDIVSSDIALREQFQVPKSVKTRTEQLKTKCDYYSNQQDSKEIINKLLCLVQSQNTQIQLLQAQVGTLLSTQNEKQRELNEYPRPLPVHSAQTSTIDPVAPCSRLQYPKSPTNIGEFEERQKDEKGKKLIKEKKVSIGVMTSFELTVQDSVVYNVGTVPPNADYAEKSYTPINRNQTKTPVPLNSIPKGPLEQIVEDSESHLSSTLQASNNFRTCSSAKKSVQANYQSDSTSFVEPSQQQRAQQQEVPVEVHRVANNPPRALPPVDEVANAVNGGTNIINKNVQSPVPTELPQNLVPKDTGEPKKTPKIGWTLYDNVMCQVNEILQNSHEVEQPELRRPPETVQESNRSNFLLNGLQQSTLEQLKFFGFTFADSTGCSEGRSPLDISRRIPFDTSYYPRLDYQANVVQTSHSASDSNTSMHMKALAMKYLGTGQLPNVSTHQRGVELITNMVLSNIQNSGMSLTKKAETSVREVHKVDHPLLTPRATKALPTCRTRFNYIVKKQEQQKICFGSGKARNIGTRSGMSSFMRCYTCEDYPSSGPGQYNTLDSFKAVTSKPCIKSISKKGYSGLGRFGISIPHVEDFPAPSEYNVSSFPAKVKQQKYPFGSTAKRKTFDVNRNPGPGLYRNITPTRRRVIFDHSFGGSVKMRLGVEMKCCKTNVDVCELCDENPIGDYWHLNNRIFMCRNCMTAERQRSRKYTKKELDNFRKIRDCSMIHSHEGTDAKVWLMHPKSIKKWIQREAYLCSYFKD